MEPVPIFLSGVDVSGMKDSNRPTAKTLIFEHGDGGRRSFLHNIGASADLTIDVFRQAVESGAFDEVEVVEFGGIELSGLMQDLDEAIRFLREREKITKRRLVLS